MAVQRKVVEGWAQARLEISIEREMYDGLSWPSRHKPPKERARTVRELQVNICGRWPT